MALLSDGGVHSHIDHLLESIKVANQADVTKIQIHCFLDGRDTSPKSAQHYLKQVEKYCIDMASVRIASIVGRYYAMDRDERWDRVEKVYNMLVQGKSDYVADSACDALSLAYKRGETDEFVKPTWIQDKNNNVVQLNDVIFFVNYRADRARQLTKAFVLDDFLAFNRKKVDLLSFITLTEYEAQLPVTVLYPPITLTNVLGEYLAKQNKTQLRIAETEKYGTCNFLF